MSFSGDIFKLGLMGLALFAGYKFVRNRFANPESNESPASPKVAKRANVPLPDNFVPNFTKINWFKPK